MALQSVGRKKYTKRKIGPTQGANVQVEQAALDTLIKAINSLPIKLGDKATIQGMKRAMRPAKRMAKQLAPKDSGFLKRQITIEKGKYTRNKAAVTINPYVVLGVKNKKVGKKNAKKVVGAKVGDVIALETKKLFEDDKRLEHLLGNKICIWRQALKKQGIEL